MPVYNDWIACQSLIQELDKVVTDQNWNAEILVLNDGSHDKRPPLSFPIKSIQRVRTLSLKRNLGHQRAICVGLAYAESNWKGDYVIIMDGDGQDNPTDIPRLLSAAVEDQRQPIVFAARLKRSENLVFRIFYTIYRYVHYLLTGHRVRVGNFSVLPYSRLATLCLYPELWNHYAAAVFKSKLPRTQISINRRSRSDDHSKMNFVGLVVHGLSAISVFGEIIGVRMFLFSSMLLFSAGVGALVVAGIRFFTNMAIPGWATYAASAMIIVGIQSLLLMLIFIFVVLSARNGSVFLPSRDFHLFVGKVENWDSDTHD